MSETHKKKTRKTRKRSTRKKLEKKPEKLENKTRRKQRGSRKLDDLKHLTLYVARKEGLYIFNDGSILKQDENYTEEEAIEMVKIENAVYPRDQRVQEKNNLGFFDPVGIYKRTLLNGWKRPENICFMKDKDMRIVSFCFVFLDYHLPKNEGMNINNVAVLPSCGGRGICQYMIAEVSKYLLSMEPWTPLTIGFEHIDRGIGYLRKSKFNIASCKCYLRVGFRLINSLSELGKRVLSYDCGRNDYMIKYNIEYKGVIYNLVETAKYRTFLLVHKDSVSEYDEKGLNQYYDIDDTVVCTKEFSGRLNESIQSGCSIM